MIAQELLDILAATPTLDVILEDEWGIQKDLKVQMVKFCASENMAYSSDDLIRIDAEVQSYELRDIEGEYHSVLEGFVPMAVDGSRPWSTLIGSQREQATRFWGPFETFKRDQKASNDRLKRTLEECSKAPWSLKLSPNH